MGTNEVWNSFLEWIEQKNCYYWANAFEDLATVIDKMFLRFNRTPVKRIKYTDMTSDIRKKHRKAIESNDFKAYTVTPNSLNNLKDESKSQIALSDSVLQ